MQTFSIWIKSSGKNLRNWKFSLSSSKWKVRAWEKWKVVSWEPKIEWRKARKAGNWNWKFRILNSIFTNFDILKKHRKWKFYLTNKQNERERRLSKAAGYSSKFTDIRNR